MAFPTRYGEKLRDVIEALGALYGQIFRIAGVINPENMSAFGEIPVIQRTPVTAWRFDYGIIDTLIETDVGGAGAVTVSESKAQLAVGANVGDHAQIETLKMIRYTPGRGAGARFTAVFATPTAGLEQIIGIGNTVDGMFFGYDGLNFGILRRRNSVDNWTYQADWNGKALGFVPNFTLGNVFQITYQWLGFGPINFYMEHPTDGFVQVHRIAYPNSSANVSILNPTLPLKARIENVSNDTAAVLQTPSGMGFVEGLDGGPVNPLDVFRTVDNSTTLSDTNENNVITLRNKNTFLTLANRIALEIHTLVMSREAGSPRSVFRVRINATFGGVMAYTDIDASNSPAEQSVTAETVSGGRLVRSYPLVSTSFVDTDPHIDELVLTPGDTITISVENSNAAGTNVSGSINFVEEF